MPNIAIIWDFDGTLSPHDSTSTTVEILTQKNGKEFWDVIKELRGDKKLPKWEHILAMDAPIWMYSLSRLAAKKKIPLNKEFFREFVVPKIELYPNVLGFLHSIKSIGGNEEFSKKNIEIHHFIISAGLKELVEQVFPEGLVRVTYGCRYTIAVTAGYQEEPESIPVFCMDETAKTRAIFEISKGSFEKEEKQVNKRVKQKWVTFSNMIYIGDGDTDIPALALTRERGGTGIVVYDPSKPKEDTEKKLRSIREGERADFITAADFSKNGDLYKFIETKCHQIRQRYEASSTK